MTREGPCFFDLKPIAEAIEFKEIPADFWGEGEPGFERDHQLLEDSDINYKGMCLVRKEGMHVVKDSVSWE